MDRHPRRRSRKALMWGGVLVVVGVVVGIVMVISAFARLDDKVGSFYRLSAPDVSQVFFDATGEYVIYDESIGIPVDGEAPFDVTVRRTGTGLEVPVSASVDDITYDTSGNSGTAVFEFSIPAVGEYEIETSVSTDAGLAQLAVGRSVLGDLLKGLVLAAVVGGGIVLAGILVAVVGSIPRSRRDKKEGSHERDRGSRERSSRRSSGEHGRSPLERRGDKLALPPPPRPKPAAKPQEAPSPPPPTPAELAEYESARSAKETPPPPPGTEFEPVPSGELPETRVVAPARDMAEPDLTTPDLTVSGVNVAEPAVPETVLAEPASAEPVSVEPVSVEPVAAERVSVEPVSVEPVSIETVGLEVGSADQPGLDAPTIEIVGLGASSLEVAGLPASSLEVEGLDTPGIELSDPLISTLSAPQIEVDWPDSDEPEGDSLRP